MTKTAAKESVSVRERVPKLDDAVLQPWVNRMEDADTLSDYWNALQGFVEEVFPQHHSATLFLDAQERVPGALTLHSVASKRPVDWWRARSRLTPTHAYLADHPGIKLYNLEEILPPGEATGKTEFFRHVLHPEGFDKLLGLTTWEKGERKSIFCVRRAFAQPKFRPWEINLLLDLHPIFDRNLRRLERVEEERACRRTLEQFISLLPQGVLLLNAKGQLVYANEEAFESCAAWNFGPEEARRHNSRAIFSVPGQFLESWEGMLEEHVSLFMAGESRQASRIRRRLSHDQYAHLQADLSLVVMEDPLLSKPFLFVQLLNQGFFSPSSASSSHDRHLAILGLLSPREREVALLVRDGLGNQEIADRLHKSLGTIKNQLQSIFEKLRIGNRARLIALLQQ